VPQIHWRNRWTVTFRVPPSLVPPEPDAAEKRVSLTLPKEAAERSRFSPVLA
jgi:hypothetical protein